jgi:putative ABC transport system ATP-binding protein
MILKIKDLKFKYTESAQNVLEIDSFSLQKGEKVFLYGPSGCGKTTFLEILAGVIVPQRGEVIFAETDLVKMSSGERDKFRANHMGYIFQSFNLIPYLNVIENITLPLYLSVQKRGKVSVQDEKNNALELCRSLGIENCILKNITELSVGQQQRVAAARAIIGSPELILADEPTSALDYDHREKFIDLLFKLCSEREISLFFVSHERSLQRLFDRSMSLVEINKVTSRD